MLILINKNIKEPGLFMNEEIKKIKEIIIKNVRKQGFKLVEIIVFGSRARGDFNNLSDWDILVVLEEKLNRDQKIELSHLIRKDLAEVYIPCDIIVKSKKEIDEQSKKTGYVVKNAIEEGYAI